MNPTNQPAPSPFLNLPRHVRDHVYQELFKSITASPPCFPEVLQENREEKRHEPSHIMYPFFPEHAFASSLLLVNRQVSAEVLEVLKSTSCEPLMYTLDCIQLIHSDVLYPTWLSVPGPVSLLSSNIDVLRVNFRLLGKFCGSNRNWSDRIESSGEALFWSLLSLLTRFLLRGVDFLSALKSKSATIELLVLNVISPDECSLGYVPVLTEGSRTPSAEVIVCEFTREINNFLIWCGWKKSWYEFWKTLQRYDRYASRQIVGENVGAIRLSVDGQEQQTIAVRHSHLVAKVY